MRPNGRGTENESPDFTEPLHGFDAERLAEKIRDRLYCIIGFLSYCVFYCKIAQRPPKIRQQVRILLLKGDGGITLVRTEHDIAAQVQAAKTDPEAADGFIRQYMGFIRSETVKFIHTAPENGHEDELSIALLAFYEAILAYEKSRGAFLPYAARAIRNRLIDHYRVEKRRGNVISLHMPLDTEDDGAELLDTIPDTVDHAEEYEVRAASQQEIQEFSEKLSGFGLTFSDVADNCPRQERTFAACRRVLDFARSRPELLKRVEDTGKLPMNELALGSGVDKKTLERHRKYLVAILLAFTNGYEIIRGHLCRIISTKGGN